MRLIALIIVLVALSLQSGAMRAEDIQIKNWPDDVPCGAVKKNPAGSYTQTKELMMGRHGSYTQTKELMMGRMRMEKNTFGKDTQEARAWDRRCIVRGGA